MALDPIHVLVLSGGSFQGLAVVKGLRQSPNVKIFLADAYSENVSKYFSDRFCLVPWLETRDAFLEAVLGICERESIELVIPSTDLELDLLAENAEGFQRRGIHAAVSNLELLRVLSDKQSLYCFLGDQDFPYLPLQNLYDPDLHFPVIGKPRVGWGSKGIIVLRSRDELEAKDIGKLASDYVWQPFLSEFEEYSIDFAIGFDGKPSYPVLRKRLRTIGGFAVICESASAPDIEPVVKELVQALARRGGRGIFNLQVLVTESAFYFSDINPRIGTSAVFGNALGVNLPLFLCASVKSSSHQAALPREKRPPLKMVRYLEELWIEELDLANVRGIVFDLDDTLISQKQWILDKLEALHEEFQERLPPKREWFALAMSKVEEGSHRRLLDDLGQELGWEPAFIEHLIKAYRVLVPNRARLYPDVVPTFGELKRLDLRLGLLTDNPPASQRQKIEASGLAPWFDSIVFTRERNHEKPNSELFQYVASEMGVAVDDLVMVGDNLYRDIQGALDSGYRHGFLIQREGGFHNFDLDTFSQIGGEPSRFTRIQDLKQLFWYLPPSDECMTRP